LAGVTSLIMAYDGNRSGTIATTNFGSTFQAFLHSQMVLRVLLLHMPLLPQNHTITDTISSRGDV